MKKGILYILMSVFGLAATGCSDYLQERSETDIDKNGFLNDAAQVETVLYGIYQATTANATYGNHLSFYFGISTDCEYINDNSLDSWRLVPSNAYPTTQVEIQDAWRYLYIGIYRANDLLERVSAKFDNYTEEEKPLITVYMAEARALRALFYFELIRRFGHIPLMTTTTMSHMDPREMVQEDPAKVYEFIEADLKYAAETLPWATDDPYRKDNSYRFSKGAALGLLAKVYATWAGYPVNDASKWELAAKTAGTLINSGKHDLLDDFEDLWKNTCNGKWDPTESLIEISFYSPTYKGAADPCGRIGKWNGVSTTEIAGVRGRCAANVKVTYPFILEWRAEDGVGKDNPNGTNGDGLFDKRRDLSIANYKYEANGKVLLAETEAKDLNPDEKISAKQSYTPAKWDIEKYQQTGYLLNGDQSNINWYVLRYADVLLLYAEALNEWKNGPTNEAYAAVNKVRRRAYGTDKSTYDLPIGLNHDDFSERIRKERKYELAFEGHRRLDLVRWGIYYETIQQTYNDMVDLYPQARFIVQKYTVKGKNELMPIPQREMDLCTKFDQNPGWK